VATDVNTGEEIIIKEGSVVEAVRASISIPAIFMPVKLKNRFLMDGGIVNPVPVNVVKNMGATFVIVCNITHKPQKRRSLNAVKKQKPPAPIPKGQISAIGGSSFDRKNTALSALNNKIDKLFQDNKNKMQNFQGLINVFEKKFYKGREKIDPNTPSIFYAIIQAIYTMEYEIAKSKVKEADMIITHNIGYVGTFEFYQGKKAISEGYRAAKEALSESKIPKNKIFSPPKIPS
jgi:NTE family protein